MSTYRSTARATGMKADRGLDAALVMRVELESLPTNGGRQWLSPVQELPME